MLPFFAQGAGQAIEDTAALATCLTATSETAIALSTYETVRIPRASQVQAMSHQRATVNHLADGPDQVARDRGFAGQDPLRHSDWLYGYDAQTAAAECTMKPATRSGGMPS